MEPSPTIRILIVDDERFMRSTVRMMLKTIGPFVVEEANDGGAALAFLPSFRPDLVICDVKMAPMGGLEFIEAVRKHADEGLRNTSVILLTANAEQKTTMMAAKLKVDGYLVKPISAKQLGARLQRVLDSKKAA